MAIIVAAILLFTFLLIVKKRKEKNSTDIKGANWDPSAYSKAVYAEFEKLAADMPAEYKGILEDITPEIKPTTKLFSRNTDGVTQTELLIIEGEYKQKLADEQKSMDEVVLFAVASAIVRRYFKHKQGAMTPPSYLARVTELYFLCLDKLERAAFYSSDEAAELSTLFAEQMQEKYGYEV